MIALVITLIDQRFEMLVDCIDVKRILMKANLVQECQESQHVTLVDLVPVPWSEPSFEHTWHRPLKS